MKTTARLINVMPWESLRCVQRLRGRGGHGARPGSRTCARRRTRGPCSCRCPRSWTRGRPPKPRARPSSPPSRPCESSASRPARLSRSRRTFRSPPEPPRRARDARAAGRRPRPESARSRRERTGVNERALDDRPSAPRARSRACVGARTAPAAYVVSRDPSPLREDVQAKSPARETVPGKKNADTTGRPTESGPTKSRFVIRG